MGTGSSPACPFVDITDLPPNFARTLFLEHTCDHSGSISVFTDGSKPDTAVGFGVVFPEFCRGRGVVSWWWLVFTTELSAVILALQIIDTFSVDYFTIFSDSRNALSALNSHTLPGNRLVLSALE